MYALIYLAGVATPLAAVAIWCFLGVVLATNHGLECVAGDLTIPTRRMTRLRLWFVWQRHRLTVGRQQWHRDALAAYAAKWER